MKKTYKCKVCDGSGKIYHEDSIIKKIDHLEEDHSVKSYYYCANCNGTGEVDWVKNIYPDRSIKEDFDKIHLDVLVKPAKAIEYIEFDVVVDPDCSGLVVKEKDLEEEKNE